MLIEAGHARTYISVISLIDTNILVYRFDPRFPQKQRIAVEVLRSGVMNETLRIPHQALMVVAVVTRVDRGTQPLLSDAHARRGEELLTQFTVLYPNAVVFRTALRGAAAYQLSWFDAHLWAYVADMVRLSVSFGTANQVSSC